MSRGAKHVTMLELNAANAKQLQENCRSLKCSNVDVLQCDSLEWLKKPTSRPFDIVFLDPPFHKEMMQQTLDYLFANGYLHDNSQLYLEQENSLDWPELEDGWVLKKEKKTSQVKFGLCLKAR